MIPPVGIPQRPLAAPPLKSTKYLHYANRGLHPWKRQCIVRLLALGWSPRAIASREEVGETTVYDIGKNLLTLGTPTQPSSSWEKLGRKKKISEEDATALFEEIVYHGWMYQDEMVHWLFMERGILVHRSTVARLLKERGWSRKTLRPFSSNQSEELREAYRCRMHTFDADDMVFLDELIFNEKTGWRHHAYGPIGDDARYSQDIRRGKTWAILPAYTIHGYLPCTGIKEGYYKAEDFLEWLRLWLIPTLKEHYGPNRSLVIVLDNVSIHINHQVEELLQEAGYIVTYLPPYSPDYNPIELTFAVLKAWIRRNYVYNRALHQNFGAFLADAIGRSQCDRFAVKHFKHAAGGLYITREELERVHDELR